MNLLYHPPTPRHLLNTYFVKVVYQCQKTITRKRRVTLF
jgi:hypothetical protein